MTLIEPTTRRWNKTEYMDLAERGLFEGQRVQLIDGEIIQMPPQGHRHYAALCIVYEYLRSAFGPAHWIRMQGQLDFGADSQPEPDIAVAEHDMAWYKDHPPTALLAVEISDSSLRLDKRKAGLYAAAGIGEYWIVNLTARSVIVHRRAVADLNHEFGYRYEDVYTVSGSEMIAPMLQAEAKISIDKFFE